MKAGHENRLAPKFYTEASEKPFVSGFMKFYCQVSWLSVFSHMCHKWMCTIGRYSS
ncbi:hypothetical protein C8C93_0895 [Acidovorax sp. 93]|nr:hypothetical protein C8C93_0895 [Acidovorax sp. 93]